MAVNKKRMSLGNDSFYIINKIDWSSCVLEGLPDSVSHSISASFESTDVPGNTNTYFGYGGTESPSISFSIQIHDDYCPKGIIKTVAFYESLAYPAFQGRIVSPNCRVILGNFLRFDAICESVSVEWSPPVRDGIYLNANVSFSFRRIFRSSPQYSDILAGGFTL